MSTLALRLFSSPRLRFDSRILRFSVGGRADLLRRTFSRCAISAARCFCRARSIASSNRSRASLRFCACDRESCTVTEIPLGRCRSVTAVETLFTFCPPGPEDREKPSSKSDSRIPSRAMRALKESSDLTPLLHYSITPLLHYSITPLLHYSITPLFHYSIIPTSALRPVQYSRDRAEARAPSRLTHLRICRAAEYKSAHQADCLFRRKAFRHSRN